MYVLGGRGLIGWHHSYLPSYITDDISSYSSYTPTVYSVFTFTHRISHGRHCGGHPASNTCARGPLSMATTWVEGADSWGRWGVESLRWRATQDLSIAYPLLTTHYCKEYKTVNIQPLCLCNYHPISLTATATTSYF